MFLSTVSAINLVIILEKIFKSKENLIFILVPISLISVIFAAKINYPVFLGNAEDNKKLEFIENNINNIQYGNINREYLPVKTYKAFLSNNKEIYSDKIKVIEGVCDISKETKEDLKYEIEINYAKKGTKIQIPFLYYIGYNAKIEKDGLEKESLQISESDLGFLEVEIKEDLNDCKLIVEYNTPISYIICYIISGVSFILFIGYIIYIIRKKS